MVVAVLVGVVVGRCGGADLLLEARQGDAVDAHVAVHADVPFDRLGITFDQKVSHTSVRSEVPGVAYFYFGVGFRERLALPADAFFVTYCRGPLCVYADQALEILQAHGRRGLRLEEGTAEWQLLGYPVEDGHPAVTQRMEG